MRTTIIAGLVLAALALPGAAGASEIRICDQADGYLKAHNMTCRKAHRIGHKFSVRSQTAGPNPRLRIEGFRCHADDRIVCRRGKRYFTWNREP